MSAAHDAPSSSPWLFGAYLALIVWAPIPLGSNRYWSWAVLELWIFALAIWWLAAFAMGRSHRSTAMRSAWPALLLCCIWLAYVWAQLIPLPMELLAWLSPNAAQLHAAAAWPGPAIAAPLTVDRADTLDGALKSTAYIAFFALTLALFERRSRVSMAANTLVVSGVVQALYGALVALAGAPGEVAHGVFPNRNHFAGYLEMCLSIGLGTLVGRLSGWGEGRSWKRIFQDALAWILGPKMVLRLALTVMVIALVLSRSRMGNTAFLASVLVTGGIALALSRRSKWSIAWLLAIMLVIDIVVVGAFFGVEKVVERIERTELAEERREAVGALDVWKDYPLFGSGLGSFEMVFTRHKTSDMELRYTHAHNDYIEFLSDTGIVGLALVGTLVVASFMQALRAYSVRHDPLMCGIAFGAMMGITCLMIHSTVDFNLQIPANAMTFMLVLAFAWVSHGQILFGETQGGVRTDQPAGSRYPGLMAWA